MRENESNSPMRVLRIWRTSPSMRPFARTYWPFCFVSPSLRRPRPMPEPGVVDDQQGELDVQQRK